MKFISILRMRPGAEAQEKSLELLLKHDSGDSTQWMLSSGNTQTYIMMSELDTLGDADVTTSAIFAPYMDIETIPVVDVDETWVANMQKAIQARS